MVTVVNNPSTGESNGGMGMIVGLVVLVVVGLLFFVYGLPALRQMQSGTTINVPDQIDVTVKQAE